MLIGVCGKMGSGKDTVADFLVKKFSGRKVGFADKLKEIVKEMFDVDKEDEKGREILQEFGQAMRSIDSNVWVNFVMNNYNNDETLIISDVRYPNEANAIIDRGGIVIHLDVASLIRKKRLEKRDKKKISNVAWDYVNSHGSEVGVDLIAMNEVVKHVYVSPADDIDIINHKVMLCIPRKKLGGYFT